MGNREKMNKTELTFRSRNDTPIGDAVKRLAQGYGFEWQQWEESVGTYETALVSIASFDSAREEGKTFDWKKIFGNAGADVSGSYLLVFGVEMSEIDKCNRFAVLADWILDECRGKGKHEIVFDTVANILPPHIREFEKLLDQSLHEMIRLDGRVRPASAAAKEQAVLKELLKVKVAVENGEGPKDITLEDADLLVGMFKDGFDPFAVYDDIEMNVWRNTIKCGLEFLSDFLLSRHIGYSRWSHEDSPMMLACRRRDCELVRKMLESGWPPNHDTAFEHETPLTCAAEAGFDELFFLLLEHGADLDYVGYDYELTCDPEGERFEITPSDLLDCAKRGKNERIRRFLEEKVAHREDIDR